MGENQMAWIAGQKNHREIWNWVLKELLWKKESKEESVLGCSRPSQCKLLPQGVMRLPSSRVTRTAQLRGGGYLTGHGREASTDRVRGVYTGFWRPMCKELIARSVEAIIPLPVRRTVNLGAPARTWGMLDGDLHLGWNKCRGSTAKSSCRAELKWKPEPRAVWQQQWHDGISWWGQAEACANRLATRNLKTNVGRWNGVKEAMVGKVPWATKL